MKSQGKKIVEEANSSTADKDNDDNDNTKFLTVIAETEALRKQLAEKDRQLAELDALRQKQLAELDALRQEQLAEKDKQLAEKDAILIRLNDKLKTMEVEYSKKSRTFTETTFGEQVQLVKQARFLSHPIKPRFGDKPVSKRHSESSTSKRTHSSSTRVNQKWVKIEPNQVSAWDNASFKEFLVQKSESFLLEDEEFSLIQLQVKMCSHYFYTS